MTAAEVLDRLTALGITAQTSGEKLLLEPGSKVPPDLLAEVRQHKADLLTLLAPGPTEDTWPPPDAEELLTRWEELGRREIPVSLGVTISNLRVWLYGPGHCQPNHVASVRGWLLEGLPTDQIPEADPLLEVWRRTCLPQWRQALLDAEAAGDEHGSEYARYMLVLLGDDEATE